MTCQKAEGQKVSLLVFLAGIPKLRDKFWIPNETGSCGRMKKDRVGDQSWLGGHRRRFHWTHCILIYVEWYFPFRSIMENLFCFVLDTWVTASLLKGTRFFKIAYFKSIIVEQLNIFRAIILWNRLYYVSRELVHLSQEI